MCDKPGSRLAPRSRRWAEEMTLTVAYDRDCVRDTLGVLPQVYFLPFSTLSRAWRHRLMDPVSGLPCLLGSGWVRPAAPSSTEEIRGQQERNTVMFISPTSSRLGYLVSN